MPLAALLAVMASAAMTVGLYFMKRQAEHLPPLNGGWRLGAWWAFARDPLWMLGAALQAIGFALYFAALRDAPLSVVHTAMNGGIALFVLMAVVGLGERPQPLEWLGIACVAAGLIVLGASLPETAAAASDAHGTLWFSVILVLMALAALAADRTDHGIGSSIASGLMLGSASVFTKALAAAPSLAAALTSLSFLLMVAANLIGFALMQAALQSGRGVVVVPIFSALSNVVPIVGGILLYGEWESTLGVRVLPRATAFILAVGGAALLAGFNERQRRGTQGGKQPGQRAANPTRSRQ